MKYIYIAIALVLVFSWLRFTSHLDAQRMQVTYCFDYEGNHYVAPDERCRFGGNR